MIIGGSDDGEELEELPEFILVHGDSSFPLKQLPNSQISSNLFAKLLCAVVLIFRVCQGYFGTCYLFLGIEISI